MLTRLFPTRTSSCRAAARGLARFCATAAVALTACLLWTGSADAQPRRSNDAFRTLRQDSTRADLGLDKEQAEKLAGIEKFAQPTTAFFKTFTSRIAAAETDEQKAAIREEMAKATEQLGEDAVRRLYETLGEEKAARLKQLTLQRAGSRALLRDEVVADLKITDEQKAELEKTIAEHNAARGVYYRGEGRRASDEEKKAFEAEWTNKVAAALNDSQREAWQKKLGPPPTPKVVAQANAIPESKPEPEKTPASTVADAKPAAPPKPAGPKNVAASFGAQSKTAGKLSVKSMSFNFKNALWVDVLPMFAEAAGLTLDMNDAVPPGSFDHVDDQLYTPIEALNIINGYLLRKGYVLVHDGKFLVVVNVDNGIPPNLIPRVSVEELNSDKRGSNEILSIAFNLDPDIDAAEVAKEFEAGILGPQGKAVPLSKSNSIVVRDIASILRQVNRILENMKVADPKETMFKQFALRYISATDAERLVRSQLGLASNVTNVSASTESRSSRYSGYSRYGSRDSDRGRDSGSSSSRTPQASTSSSSSTAKVSADPRTNTLLVTATAAEQALVEEITKAIDVSEDAFGHSIVVQDNTPRLEVYHVNTADPTEVTKTLNVIMPGVVVNEDGRARKIHIMATPAEHREVAALIRRLDGDGQGGGAVTVIPLSTLDPLALTATLRNMFIRDGDDAPVIEADTYGNRLIVRGTQEHVDQIKMMLLQLGEDGTRSNSQYASTRLYGTGRTRVIPLGGQDPAEFLPLLRSIWETTNPNPVNIVTPVDAGSIRDRRVPGASLDRPRSETENTDAATRPRRPQRDDEAGSDALREAGAAVLPVRERLETRGDSRVVSFYGSRRRNSRPVEAAAPLDSRFVEQLTRVQESEVAGAGTEASSDSEPTAADVSEADASKTDDDGKKPDPFTKDQTTESEKAAAETKKAAAITITVRGGDLIITSDDPEALNRFEDAMAALSQTLPPRNTWTVFYLRASDAIETGMMLEQIFPSASVADTAGSDGSVLGGITSGVTSFGSSVMDLTGLSSLGEGPQTLRIIPDPRANSLFVSGPAGKVREVEDVLKILDATELPESLRDRVPRAIPVNYANVTDVADMVKELYKDYMVSEQQRQQNNNNPFAAMMGGGGSSRGSSRGGRGGGNQGPKIDARLTVAVDTQTSQLLIGSNESLFQQIQTLVEQLDAQAKAANRITHIVNLQNANAPIVAESLGSMMTKVQVSTTASPQARTTSSTPASSSSSSSSSSGDDEAARDARRAAFFEMMRNRGGGGDSSGGSTGGRPSFGRGGGDSGRGGGDSGRGGGDSGRSSRGRGGR